MGFSVRVKKGKSFKQKDSADIASDLDGLKIKVGFMSNPELAFRATENEFGNEKIPARPFMRPAFIEHRRDYLATAAYIIKRRLDKKAWLPLANDLGDKMVRDVQAKIDSGVTPANALSTVRKKGHDHTLIDTGEMRDGVEYKIEGARASPGKGGAK